MRKWTSRILLIVLLIVVSWFGFIYHCALHSKQYNVLIEVTVPGFFGISHGIGSGVIVSSDGWILTAKHCLENVLTVRVTLPDRREFDVTPDNYYVDSNNDVGFINLNIETLQYTNIADSNEVTPNSIIYNIGNGEGIWDSAFYPGIVHQVHFKRQFLGDGSEFIFARMYALNGCSGGGVYHYNDLIGILVMGNDGGVNFIVPSNVCKSFYERCRITDLFKNWLMGN